MSAIKITLDTTGGGRLDVTSLSAPSAPSRMEQSTSGAQWEARAVLVHAGGKFQSLDALKVGDITFKTIEGSVNHIVVTIPGGPDRKWPGILGPIGAGELDRARSLLDRENKLSDLGSKVKLHFKLPGEIVSHGFTPSTSGASETVKKEDGLATLLVPTDMKLMAERSNLIWTLTWTPKEKSPR